MILKFTTTLTDGKKVITNPVEEVDAGMIGFITEGLSAITSGDSTAVSGGSLTALLGVTAIGASFFICKAKVGQIQKALGLSKEQMTSVPKMAVIY